MRTYKMLQKNKRNGKGLLQSRKDNLRRISAGFPNGVGRCADLEFLCPWGYLIFELR